MANDLVGDGQSVAVSDLPKLEITFSPERPPALSDLGTSFIAIDRLYRRHTDTEASLVLTGIRQGSIVATLAATQPFFGGVMPALGSVNDIVDFGKTLRDTIRFFADYSAPLKVNPSTDAEEIKAILAPIARNGGGKLNLKSYAYRDQKREFRAEFNDKEVAQAYIKAESLIAGQFPDHNRLIESPANRERWFTEETLILEQTSRTPGK